MIVLIAHHRQQQKDHRRILQEADADTLANRGTRYRPSLPISTVTSGLFDNRDDHFFYNEVDFKEYLTYQKLILYTVVVC